MIKSVVAVFLVFILLIAGLGVYLGPDDLVSCGAGVDDTRGCHKADAIIAVSGGDTSARAGEAIRLYQQGWADTLIFSGAAQDKTGPSNASAMRSQALRQGVPESAIITEDNSETTRQNAEQTKKLLQDNDIQTVILVTSAYHQRRASLEFNKQTDGMAKILNHPVAEDNQWSRLWWMTFQGWWLAGGEFFKIIAFYLGASQ